MKRSKDDGCAATAVGSPVTRPVYSRGDLSGQPNTVTAITDSGNQKFTTNDILTYLKEVKETFKNSQEKYARFLEAMKDFKERRIDTNGVIERVKHLFRCHRELALGFNTFLPNGYEIILPVPVDENKPVEFEDASNFANKVKTRLQNDDRLYKSFTEILNMYMIGRKTTLEVYQEVSVLLQNHQDLLDEFSHFLPKASTVAPTLSRRSAKPTMRHGPLEKKNRTHACHADHDHNLDRPNLVEKRIKRGEKGKDRKEDKRDRNDKELGHDIREYNTNHRPKVPSRFDDSSVKQSLRVGDGVHTKEFSFCERVKENLDTDNYWKFLRCLHIYSAEIISRTELKSLVSHFLCKYPDLMDGLNDFLAHCENIDEFLGGISNKKRISRFIKAEDRDKERKQDRDDREIRQHDKEREKERDGIEKCASFIPKDAGPKVSSLNMEKYNNSISALDLSNCQRCTPSYCLLPKNYSISQSSHRTDIGATVLNDVWVSVTSGSEDYSFKHMHKNQYEESLFRCEDDRFELDMLLESVNATTKRVEEFLEKLHDNTIKPESPINMEDHFTALNLRCFERLYGDHGLDVMDILRRNPCAALPIILTRLKQKKEEWSKCRYDLNNVWSEIFAKNYHKSLDHRSLYFKQQDKKCLGTKAVLAEIKKINEKKCKDEKKHKEDDALLAVTAANWRPPIIQNMEFEFTDLDIHKDLYQIIKYSCGELCSSLDQVDKVMKIWTTFLELLLGPSQPHSAEDTEDTVKTKSHVTRSNIATVSDGGGIPGADCVGVSVEKLNPVSNNGEGLPTEERNLCRTRLANGESTHQNDNIYSTSSHGIVHSSLCVAVKASGVVIQTATGESLADSSSVRGEPAHGVFTVTTKSALTGPERTAEPLHNEVLPSSEGVGNARPVISANGRILSVNTQNHRCSGIVTHNIVKDEREVGELPHNGDFKGCSFTFIEESAKDSVVPKVKESSASIPYQVEPWEVQICKGEAAADNDVDADVEGEESAQRSTEDSENTLEAGENVSSNEYGEECSREHNEEEDANNDDQGNKAESEFETERMVDARDAECGRTLMPFSERFLDAVKPLAKHAPSVLHDKENKSLHIFYGNDSFYVLFRLHQVLYERILWAKTNSMAAERNRKTVKDTNSLNVYAKFMSALYNLLDGSGDNTKFEDECHAIIGTQSYVLFTLDRLIYKVVEQLQVIASDEVGKKLLQLYAYEKSRMPGRFVDHVYHENVCAILHDESIYRFESQSSPTHLSIQLMDNGHEKPEVASVSRDQNFITYLNNDLLAVTNTRISHDISPRRIIESRFPSIDECSATCKAMDGVKLVNGSECKISSSSPKVSYVLDTEDVLNRNKKRKILPTSYTDARL